MDRRNQRAVALLVGLLGLATLACGGLLGGGDESGPPRNAVVIDVAANTGVSPWIEEAAAAFNEAGFEDEEGQPFYVTVEAIETGEAVNKLAAGADVAGAEVAMWVPDDQVWVNLLADQGNGSFRGDCASIATSPLVIGVWRQVAESLGWPGLPLGWLDVGSLAADPSTWNYYSGDEYGDSLRLGHTHPGLSGSGASTLLAIVQAAQSKTEAVTVDDIQQPIVQASVGAFEGGVAWFSSSTDGLGATMSERGPEYLGAGVMYESTLLQHANGEIVPIYPLEGTFVASHPACINAAADSAVRAGAERFRDYLLGVEGQELAVAYGLRPVNDQAAIGPPLDASHGVDLEQPAIVFNTPSVEAVYAVQDLWQAARKDVNLVMLLDTSGSMRGDKMESVRAAAVQFVEQMGEDDRLALIAFDNVPQLIAAPVRVGDNRQGLIDAILRLEAGGDTTLYDAIGDGANLLAASTTSDSNNALVVLTDGQDTASYRYEYNTQLIDLAAANDTTVFTIAYGDDADTFILGDLATQANGNFFLGDEASIDAIYEELSAAFGGNVGFGR